MNYNIDRLKEMVSEKYTFGKMGKELGYSDVYVRKLCIKLGIIIPRKIKRKQRDYIKKVKYCVNCNNEVKNWGLKYCSKECNIENRLKEKYKDFLINNHLYCRADYSCRNFKKHFLKEQDYKCDICKMKNDWNNKILVFILDHIDGDASNNKRNNLRLICPNCDSQLDTYKSKNKNSARKERYLKNYKN